MGARVLMVVLAGRIPYTSQRAFSSSSSLRADSMSALRRLSVCLRVLAGREGSPRGARDCEAPGPGHCRCEAGPGARAT
jgi:hypothetical protein